MRLPLIALFAFISMPSISMAQKGFVITTEDSIFHGYMRFSSDGQLGTKLLITHDKKVKPRVYHMPDLKYYAYKKDTFAILRDFYPFEGQNDLVDLMEARIIVSKGRLKLFYGALPSTLGQPAITPLVTPNSVGVVLTPKLYTTYIVKDQQGKLIAIQNDKEGFKRSILPIVDDYEELAAEIEAGNLTFKDMKVIILRYNAPR